MQISFDLNDVDSYRKFLAVKSLPTFSIRGRVAEFPDEYAARLGIEVPRTADIAYKPLKSLFDYQRDIARMAIEKQKFSVFADCGLGKTLILLEFARHAAGVLPADKPVLIISPLMVIDQTLAEAAKFYRGKLTVAQVPSSQLAPWLESGRGIGITNYEALRNELPPRRVGCLILDESSMLKSHYGNYAQAAIELGKGVDWKLCCTGTPAPNDRIEYANHAVFMDAFPTVNSFLARYFVNRGQTCERWELKRHALEPFYRALSHWCIFLSNPAVYGWRDHTETLPPIRVHVEPVELTAEQNSIARGMTGTLFASNVGGITNRTKLGRLAKGTHAGGKVETLKPAWIVDCINEQPERSTIAWCLYNDEQSTLAKLMPDAANISGDTPHEERMRLIEEFKSGAKRVLISKPKILGFGLNLQRCTRMIFSGLQDSYESFYQAVKRANRFGATEPLDVYIPATDLELPMIENVLRKAAMIQQDTEEQERIFRHATV